mmetsp:Transcript_19348/g.26598  ORF Transcript_19348/g.26598 Transcript_19348/m.26598 type:complete len:136 (-) Transcript_19348:605-1012(-)
MPHQAGNGSEQCSYALTGLDAAQDERETIAETLRGAGLQGPPSIQPASHSSSSSSSSLASEQEGPVLRSGRRPIPTPAPTGYQQLLPSLGPTLPYPRPFLSPAVGNMSRTGARCASCSPSLTAWPSPRRRKTLKP